MTILTPTHQAVRPDTVLHALARAVAAAGDTPFLHFVGGRSYSFADIDRLSTGLAHGLAKLGIGKGDRVVTILDTSVDSILCWFAINKLGAIWVPLNTAYHGEFLRHQIADSGAHLVIAEQHYVSRVTELAGDLPAVVHLLSRGAAMAAAGGHIRIEPLDSYRDGGTAPFPLTAKPAELAALMYTSGTTGLSKGCMISHNYLCNCGLQAIEAMPPAPGDIGWNVMPLFHMGAVGIVIIPALLSHTGAALSERFSVSGFWSEIEQSGASYALIAAAMAPLLANAPDDDAMHRCFGQLKRITVSPIATDIREIWKTRFGLDYINSWGFGQTEGNRLTTLRYGDPFPPDGSVGRAAGDFEVLIVDEDDQPVPAGTVGEIIFRPRRPHVMFEGYWNRPDATVAAMRNMWMHGGDLGWIDAEGHLYFVDRKKDSLRSRGENISSFELESIFVSHPAISEAAVHTAGYDGSAEDAIKLTAVLAEGATLDPETLCRWCMEKLPYFAVPRFFEFRQELIKNPTGRVLKVQLREQGCTPGTWDREAAGILVRRAKQDAD